MAAVSTISIGDTTKASWANSVKSSTDSLRTDLTGLSATVSVNLKDATEDYTILDDDGYDVILTDATSTVTITLPTASDNSDRVIEIFNKNTGKGKIVGEGSETINATSSATFPEQYNYATILCDGSNWLILNRLASYDTGWINRSDWSNVEMGSSVSKDADSNVAHDLNTPLSKLLVRIFVSTDGTEANSLMVIDTQVDVSSAVRGITLHAVDDNNFKVQTGTNGIIYVADAGGGAAVLDTEDWYYKIRVYLLG